MGSIKKQLSNMKLKSLKLSNGETLAEIMIAEANRLYDCIQYYIDTYYKSYTPVIYKRTGDYQKALKVEDIANIRVIGDTIKIGLVFDSYLSMHSNLEGVYSYDEYWLPIKDRHETFVPIILEKGWYAPRLASMIGHSVYRLTYFDGIHAVEKVIADFNRDNKYGIKINADYFYNSKAY